MPVYSLRTVAPVMTQKLLFDPELIKRYNSTGPRYTSYPTAVQFHDGFGERQYRRWAQQSNEEPIPKNLSLYFHLPFCDTICYYCACNKVVTKNHERLQPYLRRLHREIELQAVLFDQDRTVTQLHWGGGTPTFLNADEMRALMRHTREHFTLAEEGEYSIEIDPRKLTPDTMTLLRELGFNRVSLGVQDFDPQVQKAVNRIQTEEETFALLDAARAEGFKSVNLDLIYGLPHQSVDGFGRTLDRVIEARPDRLSVFNYAHLPRLFKPQRRIHEADLPAPDEKLRILARTIEKLNDAGYVYIGMDHFALPEDELAVAQRNGTLYRNFQGYSTHADCDLVAMGITAIGKMGDSYGQNVRTLEEYYTHLDAGRIPVFRGVELNDDDRVRREVISELACHGNLEFESLQNRFGVRFQEYFQHEREELRQFEADDLVAVDDERVRVLPRGRMLTRNICMVFDRYLRSTEQTTKFSRVI